MLAILQSTANPIQKLFGFMVQVFGSIVLHPLFGPGVLAVSLVIILFWTVERLTGERDDPTLRYQSSSETGSTSILLSGTHVVAVVAFVGVLAVWPSVMAGEMLIPVLMTVLVLAHWVVEKRERS